jgi:hypothetical protein
MERFPSVRVDASLSVQLLQDYLGLSLDWHAIENVGPFLPPIRRQCDMYNVTACSIYAKDPLADWVGRLDVPFVHVFILFIRPFRLPCVRKLFINLQACGITMLRYQISV